VDQRGSATSLDWKDKAILRAFTIDVNGQRKKAGHMARLCNFRQERCSDNLHILGLQAFRPLGNLELNLLALFQRLEAF